MSKFHWLLMTSIAAGLCLGNAQGQNAQGRPGSAANSTPAPAAQAGNAGTETVATIQVPLIMLVPLEFRADPNLAKGCWVRLYNDKNFKGSDELTIVGPIDLGTLKMPSGVNWKRRAESLIAGPNATVTVYENELFKDKTVTYSPGQKVDNLRKSLGIFHAIDSLKVACPAK
jgi:hypothetical protein